MKTLTKDVDAVVSSLADSEIVKVSDDKKRIKRRNPLPEEDTLIKRSIYAVRCQHRHRGARATEP